MNKEAVIVILDCNSTMNKMFKSQSGQGQGPQDNNDMNGESHLGNGNTRF